MGLFRRAAPALRLDSTRVYVRHPQPQDAQPFLDFVRENRDLHEPWVRPPQTLEQYRYYLDRVATDRHQGFLVFERRYQKIVGVINLNEIIRGLFQNSFVGYYGNVHFKGAGYMTEGMGLIIRHAFEVLALHRLEANIQPTNEASIALVKRLGFRFEGLSPRYLRIDGAWRDHQRWALCVEDWRQKTLPESATWRSHERD